MLEQRLNVIAAIRQDNLRLFTKLAALLSKTPPGWVARPPGGPDPTMALLRAALEEVPAEARTLLVQIADNDAKILNLEREIAYGT